MGAPSLWRDTCYLIPIPHLVLRESTESVCMSRFDGGMHVTNFFPALDVNVRESWSLDRCLQAQPALVERVGFCEDSVCTYGVHVPCQCPRFHSLRLGVCFNRLISSRGSSWVRWGLLKVLWAPWYSNLWFIFISYSRTICIFVRFTHCCSKIHLARDGTASHFFFKFCSVIVATEVWGKSKEVIRFSQMLDSIESNEQLN